MRKIKIGKIESINNIFLAPMAGISDLTFRTIYKGFGVGLVYTEMISAKGLYYKDGKTSQLMKTNKNNIPTAVQIFGSDPDIMAYVVENDINYRDDIDIIDINMGCPVLKVVKGGDGSALMKSPNIAGQIVNKIKKVSNKPVTVKIRAGWDSGSINAVEFAKVLEFNGADLITVHGRTKAQMYSGKADYNIIKEVKKSVKISIIGNGDIYTPQDALNMLEFTDCDGIMVARGVLGNPWLILNISKILNNDYDFYEPAPREKIEMIKKHSTMLKEESGEKMAVLEMRKHVGWYVKGLKNSSELRNKINSIGSIDEMFQLLDMYILNY